jgi:hypothetical protein
MEGSDVSSTVHRSVLALGVVIALVCGGLAGWTLARRDGGARAPGLTAFDAVVDSVDPDGLHACVSALDPAALERFGGSVCGRVFGAADVEVAPLRRVHVEWFSVVTRADDESVQALVLTPLHR